MKQIIQNKQSAFVLAESMLALIIVSVCMSFEYEQVHQFHIHKSNLERKLKVAERERIDAMNQWEGCNEK
ncbi:hypothetical protein [Leuconostoc mesenteroides]|uniref:Prepilin-type cleavage/methylation N-terminal domain protein n=1 Tax=Leuconostoc mesenteroides subsp. cremoris ATCC 19254 TaxID=586220 RepID=C2KLF4_LEUMC|nr:hypothetical protein [Leuconostoc mesenteroides]EQC84331.1 hypothetical protein LMT8_06560 [Leuconostoc mesenteroides subsp. cremoris TIFN8]EEJ41932.1 prepilin-type cleavage/methylation N-terminal domain protein [Leuconostoc mesenteroides subsp. cremoris ATCC 19254]ORI35900.1 hypothetical protein BMR90_07985 [Leuconostoc mesenteroides subsp. cremoris]ORI36205.1 hypothetical protein BMR89_07280 [Leuconostoc mesenteroides subsp. cremoris]ORI40540.1 hypothetical protein BMR91_07365 [Leuconosto